MSIKFGDVEYFELHSLNDALKNHYWNRLPLANFEKLRHEVTMAIAKIDYQEKESCEKKKAKKEVDINYDFHEGRGEGNELL